ncbi:MAG: hypothetical protein ACI4TJ_08275 [Candidatus Cryptobacteroides sp.]
MNIYPERLMTRLCSERPFWALILTLLGLIAASDAFCCTSVIISAGARADGRPVMMKHRDSGDLNNRIQRFTGPAYSFIGLVDSSSDGGEVWSGTNEAGFCIMNTATYDLKDDDVPAEMMDREGILMYKALGICRTLGDFEIFLDTLSRPMGVEANFGVVDACGGAAYYEVDNSRWVKFDVNEEPGGYMVVTNFTRSGRPQDRRGVDRFGKACDIMSSIDISVADHRTLFNLISRSGDPITRKITSSSIVFEGVSAGEDPLRTVMWTILGSPCNCIYLPIMVSDRDRIPFFMKGNSSGENRIICDYSLIIKGIYGYTTGCKSQCTKIEEYVDSAFRPDMGNCAYACMMRKAYRKYVAMCRRSMPKLIVNNCVTQ